MTWFAGSIILGIAASELASASGACSSEDAWVVSRGLFVRSSSEVKEKDSFSEIVAPEKSNQSIYNWSLENLI